MNKVLIPLGLAAGLTFLVSCGEKGPDSAQEKTGTSQNAKVSRILSGINSESKFAKELSAVTTVFEGGDYHKTEVKDAEKYILYYTASW